MFITACVTCIIFFPTTFVTVFQTYLLTELLSPLITPLALYFYVRPRALDIVDFFRNFTVEVVGVGDVCSFAQMDVRRHGNPAWQAPVVPTQTTQPPNQYNQVILIIIDYYSCEIFKLINMIE